MSRMRGTEQVTRCAIHAGGGVGDSNFHMGDCEGLLITRMSIHGAVSRSCEKGWESTHYVGNPVRELKVNISGWPIVVEEQPL